MLALHMAGEIQHFRQMGEALMPFLKNGIESV